MPCSSHGIHWKSPPTGMRNFPLTRVDASLTMRCLSSSISSRNLSLHAVFNAKAPGYEADDFLASATHAEEKRGGTVLIASGDRDTFQLVSDCTTILYPVRAGEMARVDPAEVRARYGSSPPRFRTSSPCAAIPRTSCRALRGLAPPARQRCCSDMAPLKQPWLPVVFPHRLKTCGYSGRSRQ